MTGTWGSWTAWSSDEVDPYADFDDAIGGESTMSRNSAAREAQLAPELAGLIKSFLDLTEELVESAPFKHMLTADQMADSEDSSFAEFLERTRLRPKIPGWAGRLPRHGQGQPDWLPEVAPEDAPPEGSVIVGVIDRGVALHHRGQRFEDGSTRIVGAWQQIVDQSLADDIGNKTQKPPFGLAYLKPDIDRALDAAGLDGPDLAIDVEAFNRDLGQADFVNLYGHRELSRAAAHGSHVLDAATGVFPGTTSDIDKAFREQVRPMVVNLPDREIIGLSSRNLSYFVILGMLWMIFTADRYWFKAHLAEHSEDKHGRVRRPFGYPMVINLSFAKQAGARSGDDDISQVLEGVNRFRMQNNFYPVFVTLPAGNDNLDRGNGIVRFPSATSQWKPLRNVEWRIVPEDQSSNYLEIWFESDDAEDAPEIELFLTDPKGRRSVVEGLRPGHYTGLRGETDRDIARIYYEVKEPSRTRRGPRLKRYLVCVGPTRLHDGETSEAPSGIWRLTLRNVAARQVLCSFNVQTDQSDQPGSRRSRLSFLDDPDYQRVHPETGRPLDSYNYPEHRGPFRYPKASKRKDFDQRLPPYRISSAETPAVVRRHGTLNAMAHLRSSSMDDGSYLPGVTIAGGYRLSDGKPAPYSSTGLGYRRYSGGIGIGAPTVAYPSDDGYAHRGRLAAGANDGSVRAMQGTSFAVAQLSRKLAAILMNPANQVDPDFPLRKAVGEEAEAQESPSERYGRFADPEKVGSGRLDMAPRTRVARRES
ncbi:MAG: hypothetical protein AAGI09_09115 [Pseudomonadota bacterium]